MGLHAELLQYDEPEWGPLVEVGGVAVASGFMWMCELELDDGQRLQSYKHRMTRRYLRLTGLGEAYDRTCGDRYAPIPLAAALEIALDPRGEGRHTIRTMPELADAALDEMEREVLHRLVAALKGQYGDDLDAVWLYGSRARGERTHDESDVDVLVVTRSDRDDEPLLPTLWRVLGDLGSPRVLVDPRQRSRGWVEDRRAIDSFFLREVDRDKIVLYGIP